MRRTHAVVAVLVIVGIALSAVLYRYRPQLPHEELSLPAKEEVPRDLASYRDDFAAGMSAIEREDGRDAVAHLEAFTFGDRPIEEYRLYYLARGFELAGDSGKSRRTLAALFREPPRLVHRDEAGLRLAALYREGGDWNNAARALVRVGARSDVPSTAGAARWEAALCRFRQGDVAGALQNAREVVIDSPRSEQAARAALFVRALSGSDTLSLTHEERYQRALALMRDGDAGTAIEEFESLGKSAPPSMSLELQVQRGIALHRLRRYEESNRVLEPLAGSYFKYAVPAIHHASKNYRTLAASIDPRVYKTVKERKRVGTVKVRVGKGEKRRTVSRPKYATVTRRVELIDLAKKAKKEEYGRLASERLKDLLQLPIDEPIRVEVLNALIAIAVSKNQDAYAQELVPKLIEIDPLADPALQHFWDKAWAAWLRGDLKTAIPLLRFIADTYRNPNVRRQAEYWYARAIERAGRKEEAAAIYARLAGAPYRDIYALHALSRGAVPVEQPPVPNGEKRPDWGEIAERNMPAELRLAHELTALSQVRDARLEIQKNVNHDNRKYANALLADLYNTVGNALLMYRTVRLAYPELATVEQDRVPEYFVKMYYPSRYDGAIRKHAKNNGLDPFLVKALILQESYYNPKARSRVGATGLMQIMPATGRELARILRGRFANPDLEDPEENIELGTLHLRRLIRLFGGNTHLAVASYNAGQGNVIRWRRAAPRKPMDEFLESIPFAETRNYVKRVTMLRSAYEKLER